MSPTLFKDKFNPLLNKIINAPITPKHTPRIFINEFFSSPEIVAIISTSIGDKIINKEAFISEVLESPSKKQI
jgi:hypothetical protein